MNADTINKALEVLRENDLGDYTVPTKGLYPFQWNWDSCLTALGFSYFDEERAWLEIDTLFAHQWEDGMVPHIVFHKEDDGYFPGPNVWLTNRKVPTSGITQPPVAGFVIRKLLARAKDKDLARGRALALLHKVHKWHQWFYACRDPKSEGLVAILHPWESGRDNSIDWDKPFERVPTEGVQPYQRRDTEHANPEHRPTQAQYDRYIWLVQHYRSMNWDNSKLHDASPFQVIDPGLNAILIRSCSDLAEVARDLGELTIADESKAMAEKGQAALEKLWSEKWGQYLCYDRANDEVIESPSIGGILPVLASDAHAGDIAAKLEILGESCEYLVPSHDPKSADFDSLRYWRGPAWLIINYMISDGLQKAGENEMAERIKRDSVRLIEESGFAEYYDPITAEPCGGGRFTWTAAMVIEFLKLENT